MLINHCEKSLEDYQNCGKNKRNNLLSLEKRQIKVLQLIWGLIKILFRHGNQEVYYHICGSLGKDAWDCPMEAEGLSIRMTKNGKKLTIW